MEKVTIQQGDRTITLVFREFDDEINIDELTAIDYSNLYNELLTIPTLMNRVGILKADADNRYAQEKLSLAIYEATQEERYRKELVTRSGDKVKPATVSQLANAVTLDQGVQLRRKKLIRLAKEAAYMDSLYWAVKSKEQKLNKIGEKMPLTPEDFEREITEGVWNGILIKSKKSLVPSGRANRGNR